MDLHVNVPDEPVNVQKTNVIVNNYFSPNHTISNKFIISSKKYRPSQ